MCKKIAGMNDIWEKYSTYLFDLDGVFWKGQVVIQNSIQCLKTLREMNKRLFFITNSSVRNRSQVQKKFQKFGFIPQINEIYSSSYLAGIYIKAKYPEIKKIICLSSESMKNQLVNAGFDTIKLNAPHQAIDLSSLIKQVDVTRQALVIGYDSQLNYNKACLASLYVQHGVKVFGTNPDKYTIIDGFKMPGTGCIIKTIQTASDSKAQIMGKPNPFLIEHILTSNSIKRQQCLMIGDNLETDVLFAQNYNVDTLCVLTGVTKQAILETSNIKPTYYCQYL